MLRQVVNFADSKLHLGRSVLEGEPNRQRAVLSEDSSSENAVIPDVGLVLESVGFGFPLFDTALLPFHSSAPPVPNCERGEARCPHDASLRFSPSRARNNGPPDYGPLLSVRARLGRTNLFAAGWAKRGPQGTIASNVPDAQETAQAVLRYLVEEGEVGDPVLAEEAVSAEAERASLDVALENRATSFADWKILRQREEEEGANMGKSAVKVESVSEMLQILKRS